MAQRTHQNIAEIDQLIESWPGSAIHPVQISPGSLDFVLDGAVGRGLSVIRMSLSPGLMDSVQIGSQRTGLVLVESPMISMGMEITPPALLINHSGREYHSVLKPGFRSVEFMVDTCLLGAHPLGVLLAEARAAQEQTVIALTPSLVFELKAVADAYIAASELGEADEFHPQLLREARERVFRTLCSIISRHRGDDLSMAVAPASGSLALAALMEIERMGLNQVRVKEVCTALGVSRRAVEKSFDAVLGISPAQYLLACRLNRLRRSLLGSTLRVADGLADAGLADPSRAARQYRRLFGELPSVTLRRAQERVTAA